MLKPAMCRSLPRDARDTLFLLAVISWVIAPHMLYLPWWSSVLSALVLLWRARLALMQQVLPGRWVRLVLLLGILAVTHYTHQTLISREAGMTLIIALLALKTLELRARRDAFVISFLGFFASLTLFFHAQSLLHATHMLGSVLGLLSALINSHLSPAQPLQQSARLAVRLNLLGAPLMLVLFLFFPRVAPLWGTSGDPLGGRSGLSATMQVGQIARLALDDTMALRAQFEGRQPQAAELYWRGPVLGTFDGHEWQALLPTFSPALRPPAALLVSGEPLRYQVTLQPHNRPWLIALDAMPSAPVMNGPPAIMRPDLQWLTSRPLHDVTHYRAESYPLFRHGPSHAMPGLQDYLELPPGYNPRTLALALELQGRHGNDPRILIEAMLQRLRDGGYRYTLEPGVFGRHTADEFWFDARQGFCEHIASAFAVLLRAIGIPARIVTGYQGGERNLLDGDWVVRQSDAHAWVEAWLSGSGWVRIDPTAAVAPARVGELQRLLAPSGVLNSAIHALNPDLARRMRMLWDAMNQQWNQWVLHYSPSRQLDLLRSLGIEQAGWETLIQLLFGCSLLLAGASLLWRHGTRTKPDPWLQMLAQARQRMQGLDPQLPAQATPRAMAQRLLERAAASDPAPRIERIRLQRQNSGDNPGDFHDHNRAQSIADWLLELEKQRYAKVQAATPHAALRRLQQTFRQLNWPK